MKHGNQLFETDLVVGVESLSKASLLLSLITTELEALQPHADELCDWLGGECFSVLSELDDFDASLTYHELRIREWFRECMMDFPMEMFGCINRITSRRLSRIGDKKEFSNRLDDVMSYCCAHVDPTMGEYMFALEYLVVCVAVGINYKICKDNIDVGNVEDEDQSRFIPTHIEILMRTRKKLLLEN